MEHTHITFSSGPRLIRIDSGDDDQLILCSLLNLCKAVRIVADRILIISGAGTDDHQEFITLAGNDLFNFFISFFLKLPDDPQEETVQESLRELAVHLQV